MKLTVSRDGVFLDSTRIRRVTKVDLISLTPDRKTALLEIDVDEVDIKVPDKITAAQATTRDL